MASLNTTPKLRPCIVDNDEMLFHCWVNVSQIVSPSIMVGGHNGGVISDIFGLVENKEGKVLKVYTKDIRFLDSGNHFHDNYIFFETERRETTNA